MTGGSFPSESTSPASVAVNALTSVAGRLTIVGSTGVATNNGALLHPLAGEDEIKHIKSILKADVDIGTVNRGTGFVRTGILANTKDVLLGDMTTGPEIMRIEDALGLL